MAEGSGASAVVPTQEAPTTGTPASPASEPSASELLGRLSSQSSRLVRDELKLAQLELTAKAKHAGVGAGLFGGAGLVALYGVGALVATAIIALALVLPAWLAALIVAVVLLLVAGILALVGRKQVKQATPPAPARTMDNLKQDVATLKGKAS